MDRTFKKLSPERQMEILDAAAHEFAVNGYFRANIQGICKRAEISNGALYKYFHSKEGLYLYTYNYICQRMFKEVYDFAPKPGKSIYEIVGEMLQNTEKYFRKHSDYFLMYADIWSTSMNGFVPKLMIDLEEDIDNYWLTQAKLALERGEIHPAISPEYAAYLIDSQTLLFFFSLTSAYHQKRYDVFLKQGDDLSVSDLVERMVEQIHLSLGHR